MVHNQILFICISFTLCFALFSSKSQTIDQQWEVDISSSSASHFEFWWNKCVGSGHASLALRADWQKQLKYIHDETGMKAVRFHGILNDDVGAYNGENDYSFINIFKIWDYLLSINMRPYVEISFTPNKLASGECYIDHYKSNTTPPKNYTEWNNFITNWMTETVNRYGIEEVSKWQFEIWNEPNISFLRNWINNTCADSTFDEYFKIYSNTVNSIKSVNKNIRVGGPSTAGISSWVDQFLNATITNNIAVDFISSHDYPPNGASNSVNTNIYLNRLSEISNILDKYQNEYPNIAYYLSEFNSGLFWLSQNQTVKDYDNQNTIYAASFMIFQMNKLQKLFDSTNKHWKLLSYWTFSDIFEEGGFQSNEFWANYSLTKESDYYFGMTTIRSINKPVFHSFKLVYKYGTNISYNSQIINGGNQNDNNNTISLFCLKNNDKNRYSLFITNYADYPSPFNNKTISIFVTQTIDTSLKQPKYAIMYRIDKNNGNPIQTWIDLGKPKYPTQQQMNMLNQSSILKPQNITWKIINDTTIQFDIDIPKYNVRFLDIQY